MAITSFSREKKTAKHHEGAKDRLSDLPDSVLLHILSLLPETKWAVRTSALSKRWKCLWASLPDLIFCRCGDKSVFKKFVRHVLSGRNKLPLNKICFHFCGRDKSLTTRIINYSVSHNVQHFSISLSYASLSILFPLFNRCRSLKTLELSYFHELLLLKDFSLPTLTTLRIFSSYFSSISDYESSQSIDPFVSLVNLKSLGLKYCNMVRVGHFKISGPQLDSLIYKTRSFNHCKVEIFAPKLHSFYFIESEPVKFSNIDFPLLEIAGIDAFLPLFEEEISHLNLVNMFQALYHAQSLYISSKTIHALMKYPGVLEAQASPFGRLKTLNIHSNSNSFNIPLKVVNCFFSGSAFGKDIRIKIGENRWQRL